MTSTRRRPIGRNLLPILLVAAGALTGACVDGQSSGPTLDGIRVEPVVSGLSNPVALASLPGDDRLFVVEQEGIIRIVVDGSVLPTPFLDMQSIVLAGGEQGLLGLAFHPQYATNGYFYVYYNDNAGDIRIDRFRVSSNPDLADAGSQSLVIAIPHPTNTNHNGGQLAFGPDNFLYAAIGDGGGSGVTAQSKTTLLGKIIRLDVNGASPYAIPPTNPFVNETGARGEIWAYGLRNPWRFAFDRAAQALYIADVGQGDWEEVNVVNSTEGGVNYGWSAMEGTHCYAVTPCFNPAFHLPAIEYGHDVDGGCSVTGGYVYRGTAIPAAQGLYFYSDYCTGFLRSFRFTGGQATDQREWDVGALGNVTSFGEGGDGELYILSASGTIFRIAGTQ